MNKPGHTDEKKSADEEAAEEPSLDSVAGMFDRIAFRYDTLNRLLSFGLDMRWRKRLARHLPPRHGQRILDLATGTGDQLLAVFEATDRVDQGVGMDLAEEMLALGREKVRRRARSDTITLETGDACAIPSPAGSFDAATISFGIRNVPDVGRCLREIHRVLRPESRALVLEFSLPRNRLLLACHLFYLRHVLPRIGRWLSGDVEAYRYLNRTIEAFPFGEAFCRLMRDAGFIDVQAHPLSGGLVTLYVGSTATEQEAR